MSGPQWQRWDPFPEFQREVGRFIVSLDPFQSMRRVQAYPPVNVHDASDRYFLSIRTVRTLSSRTPWIFS